MRLFLLGIFFLLLSINGFTQACTTPGQSPGTAFPVCGTSVFSQQTVPLCTGRSLPSPSCRNQGLSDMNPFYYKFTCFEAGTLGLSITPKTRTDDYDWEVYDITDRNPNDIYTDGSMVVAANWSGEGGETGASTAGSNLFVCSGFGRPLWSSMPELKKGHVYLLMISHFTPTGQSGYDLAFKGGTAVITDPLAPALKDAEAHCNGQVVRLRLNKKLRCSTLAANGSDFVIMPGNHPVAGSSSPFCSQGFDTDSIDIKLQTPLDPGNYQLVIRKGSDNNTLLDFCDNAIPENQAVSFTVEPSLPTRLDSIAPVGCKPTELHLVFRKPVFCNTVAANGSDFVITGPYPVAITGAKMNCTGGVTKIISLQLAAPMVDKGDFKVVLKRNAGGTIRDECGNEIPEGSVAFSVADTVSPAFSFSVRYGCTVDTVQFRHAGGRSVNTWRWQLDDGFSSTQQNPTALYTVFGTKNISLEVSNGVCKDSADAVITLDNALEVGFNMAFAEECPGEPVQFTSTATGRNLRHSWNFDDGTLSTEVAPVHRFAAPLRTQNYQVRYSVTDDFGCTKTATKPILIYSSCSIHVPNAFTPGNDGLNDRFRPLNVVKVEQYEFVVYNRWGQEVFRTRDANKGWDGRIGGILQGTGTYIWMMRYQEQNTKRMIERKGSFLLLR